MLDADSVTRIARIVTNIPNLNRLFAPKPPPISGLGCRNRLNLSHSQTMQAIAVPIWATTAAAISRISTLMARKNRRQPNCFGKKLPSSRRNGASYLPAAVVRDLIRG